MNQAIGRPAAGVAAVVLAVVATASFASAATLAPTARVSVGHAAAARRAPARPLAIGTVDAVTSTGGLFNRGVLTVTRPNGRTVLLSLDLRTRVFQYRGRGRGVIQIAPAALLPGDVVVVRGHVIPHRGAVALVIYDTSFNGTVNPATSHAATAAA
ncbi:MAG TPA: hypothetical protein VMW47_08015 [Verrucomicrobiae bacterium]|nr:hypothetical protein [Verrucomicrobiae bacterium]